MSNISLCLIHYVKRCSYSFNNLTIFSAKMCIDKETHFYVNLWAQMCHVSSCQLLSTFNTSLSFIVSLSVTSLWHHCDITVTKIWGDTVTVTVTYCQKSESASLSLVTNVEWTMLQVGRGKLKYALPVSSYWCLQLSLLSGPRLLAPLPWLGAW